MISDRAANEAKISTDGACTWEKRLLWHFMALSAKVILFQPPAVTTVIYKWRPTFDVSLRRQKKKPPKTAA
jgi:hypothetical protein